MIRLIDKVIYNESKTLQTSHIIVIYKYMWIPNRKYQLSMKSCV